MEPDKYPVGNQIEHQYKYLWDNMQQTNTHNFVFMGVIITASGAIMAAGLANISNFVDKKVDLAIIGLIFLCVFFITIPGQILLNGNRNHIWRLSTYIRVFLEPRLEFLKWETNVTKLAELDPQDKKSKSSRVVDSEFLFIFAINTIATTAAVICCFFSFPAKCSISTIFSNSTIFIKVVGIIIAVICWIAFSLKFLHEKNNLKRTGKIQKEYFDAWMLVNLQKDRRDFGAES